MLFKLSVRNIRRNLRNYAIYFFTLVLGTTIFYLFNSLESQTVMLNISARQHELVDLMTSVMSVLSVGVAVVLGLLIIYASRFLMKRRKSEFGIYMTLGMGKGQVSRILLIETLLIGLVSLIVGLGIGIGLSQLMSIFVANIFEVDMMSFQFVFSSASLLTTLGMFGAIYVIVMIFSAISVGRTRLIDLIHSSKMNEKIKLRNPVVCTLLFMVAVVLLVMAYMGVTAKFADLTDQLLVQYIVFGVVGTFLLFWSWSGLALRIAQRFKGFYNRKLNTFILREVDGKINTTVVSMSVISLLLFLTIGIFSSAISIRNSMTSELHEYAPADFQLSVITWLETKPGEEQREVVTAEQALENLGIDLGRTFSEYEVAKTYSSDDVTYADTVGLEALEAFVKDSIGQTIDNMLSMREHLIRVSDYNRLATFYGQPVVELADGEYVAVSNQPDATQARNYALSHRAPEIIVGATALRPRYDHTVSGFIYMSDGPVNQGFIVVPNGLDLDSYTIESMLVGNYLAESDEEKDTIEEDIYGRVYSDVGQTCDGCSLMPNSKSEIYINSVGLSVMSTFVGLYLGSVFLITSAAMLGLKEVSESSDNREKYMVLSKLGVDQKALNRTLLIQIGIFFGMPLLVAAVHSIFGIMFADKIIMTFASADLLLSIIATAVFIAIIYGGYFLITYSMSKRIVMAKD